MNPRSASAAPAHAAPAEPAHTEPAHTDGSAGGTTGSLARVRVNVLNVGQGSCAVIRAQDRVILIDGGARREYAVRTDPLAWLRAHGITRIDDLILTHLHRDHVQGLVEVARHFTVARAHLPYPAIAHPPMGAARRSRFRADAHVDTPDGQLQSLREFAELSALLGAAGSEIVPADPGAPTEVWRAGAVRLTRVFPVPGDTPYTPALVAAIGELSEDDADVPALEALADEISEAANAESAVYVLHSVSGSGEEGAGEGAVIFAGDHAGEGSHWDDILERDSAGLLDQALWLLPHHGGDDGPDAEWYAERNPRALLASVNTDHAHSNAQYWAGLRARTGITVLGTHESDPAPIAGTGSGIELYFG
ncbi:MBL fold metallo-hydrolase [Mycetocola tolaasinivorans]|uniref:MBL fold metallo-hydrolase n=1 Tax=Mycetocola tolaasinivorans TaxID=76635 RepID=A0A3L7ACA5_9MICO|nr:MBL fold metallo-hydrolase [Mycetocola tolaasinivorans]RLP78029.1 MBL fold metallo-hydrolase [Mycetocola tolaasinivorans]